MNTNRYLQYFLDFASDSYFTSIVMLILNAIFIIVSLKNRSKINYLKFFPIYGLVAFIQGCLGYFYIIFEDNYLTTEKILRGSINIFTLIEFVIFYAFFIQVIKLKHIRRVLIFLVIVLPLAEIVHWCSNNNLFTSFYYVTVLEAFLLLIPCLIFFYELFENPPILTLSKEASFWITTGILFYFSCTIPLFVITKFFSYHLQELYNQIYSINYISYSLLFILFIKGFSCKRTA